MRIFRCPAAAAAALLAACSGCGPDSPAGLDAAESISVASWNVQALFDGVEDGTEYPEYAAGEGWTEASYRRRLDAAAAALDAITEGGPDVLALSEVENERVVRDLAAARGYRWTAFAANPGAPLGVGLLSRFPIAAARVHGSAIDGDSSPRPIMEVRLDAAGAPLALFVCHWKSKLGGARETEILRRASAGALSRRLRELAAVEPDTDVLALGDFNERDDEFERVGGAYPTALLPDSAAASAAFFAEAAPFLPDPPLVASAARPPESRFVSGAVALYSPWSASTWAGSYAYRGEWERIDHILAAGSLFDGKGWDYAAFRAADAPPLTDESGFPAGYRPFSGTGYSDHLPIVAELRRTR